MKGRFLVASVVVALLLPSMSYAGAPGETEALKARAEAYWKARVARSPAMNDFYVPEDKGGPARASIRTGRAVDLEAASVQSVEVNDDDGVVEVAFRVRKFNFSMSPQMARVVQGNDLIRNKTVHQAWVRVDGVWYREPTRPFGGKFDSKDSAGSAKTASSSSGEEARRLPTDRRQEN